MKNGYRDLGGAGNFLQKSSERKIYFLVIPLVLFFFTFLPERLLSTHIVGGSLTYVYNGGSSYTVTLKLYRDCAGVALPNSATITVVGYNGATFSPSRNITINLTSSSYVPSNLDTCAEPPNPIPCVQEGIYTTTVTNLPANPGGYHMYYQQIARNISISNIDASCNCIGESFYAYIPGTSYIWEENFTLANGTTSDTGPTAWSRTLGATPPGYASVQNNLFEISGANNAQATWTSEYISISSYPLGVNISASLSEVSNMDTNDSILVYYRINGGALNLFTTNGSNANDFGTRTASVTGLTGDSVQIVIRVHYDGSSAGEIYRFDNVIVQGNDFVSNSSPVFSQFPPLFLCVGKAFTFNHAAADSNGDSLVYSFYTPYDGDNGTGPLDPTFSGNVASFQPVIWQPGYSASNPLGGTPLSLDPVTGMLTGTPSLVGQFVVGVKVKEYRSGVFLSEVLRDFQFNVVNCPPPAQAYITASGVTNGTLTVCGGNSLTFPNNSDTAATNWFWNLGDLTTSADTSNLEFPTYTYPGPGTYTATLIINRGTSCADTSTAVITVSAPPAAPTASGTTICQGNTATLTATAPGGTYQWYDAASGGNLLVTNASYTTPVLTATTTYYVQTTVNGCISSRSAVTVTVSATPAAPTASGATICNGNTATLTATAPGGTYAWYDAASGGNLLITNASYTTPALTSNTTYYVQTTLAGCTGPRTAVTVTVAPTPAAPTASGATICTGTTATITATAPGGTYQWYDAASGGNLLVANASYITPALTSNTTYYVQTTLAGCTGPRTAVTVTVSPVPAAPSASGTTICTGTTATVTATAPGGTYQWYDAASGGNLLITNASYTTPVLTASTTYYVQTTVAGCAGSRTAVSVTVSPLPAAPTASGTAICAGNTATLIATAPGGTYQWYDAASGGSLLATNASYTTPVLNSTTTYYVDATISGCAGPRTAVTVSVNPVPAAPTALGTTICSGNSTSLTATAPGGTYNWYDAASGGTLLGTNASYTTPVLITTTTYYVQTTISGCTGPRTAVTVTVNATPAAPTASGTSICTNTTASLTATAPGGTYNWYDAVSGGNLSGTGAGFTTPVLTATTTYYVQSTVSGCTSSRTAVTVTVSPIPALPTVQDTSICINTPASLLATAPGGTYQWYDAPSGGTLLATGPAYSTPALASSANYYVQTTINGCTGPRKTVTVTVSAVPAAPTASSTTICSGNTATLTATAPGGIYQWYDASSGGSLLVTNASYTTPVLTASTTYYVQTTIGGCPGPRSPATVSVNPAPASPTASGTSICSGNTTSLTATAPGGTYKWYDAASGGNLLTINASYTTPVLNTSTTYYVDATSGAGCTGPRTAVTVTVNPTPAAPTVSGTSVCNGGAATLTATAPGGTYKWYDAATGGNLLVTNSSYTTPALSATTTYYVDATSGAGCTGVKTPVTVTVNSIPASPTASGTTICSGNAATLTATAPGGTYQWYNASSAGTLLSTGAIFTSPALATTITYYVQATISGCTSISRTPVTVTVNPTPAAPTAAGTTICENSTATLTATAPGGTYNWYDAASGGNLLTTNASYTTPVLATTTTYYVDATSGAGCTGIRTAVTVTVTPVDKPFFNYSSGTHCQTGSNPTPSIPNGVTGTFSSSPAGLVFISTSTGEINPGASALGTYSVKFVTNGSCIDSTIANITITTAPDATFSYAGPYCQKQSNPLPGFGAGASAGVFSAVPAGLIFISTSTGEIDLNASAAGTYTVTNNIASSGGCAAASAMNTVTINPAASVSAGPDQSICIGNTVTMAGTIGGGASSATWSGGTGSFSNPFALNAVYTPNAGETMVKLFLTSNDPAGPCGSVQDSISITINPIPAAPTALGAVICQGNTALLTATAPGGIYSWYDAPSGGNLVATNASYTTPALSSTTNYYVQSTQLNCISPRTSVTVTVNPTPSSPNVISTSICAGNTATLTATAPGGTYDWYNAATGGAWLSSGASYTTPVLNTSTTYYVQSTISGCEGPRQAVTVTVNPIPPPPTAFDATICEGGTTTLTATAPGGTYNWYDAASGGNLLASNASYTTPVLSNTTVYYVESAISGCTGARTAVTVNVNPLPAAPTSAGTIICSGYSATLVATAPGGTYQWYDTAAGGNLLVSNSTYTTPMLAANVTYYVQTVVNGCASPRTAVTVTVNPTPASPSANGIALCSGNSTTLTATAPGGNYEWYDANFGGNLLTANANYTTPVLSSTTIYYVQTTINACISPRAAVTVTINPIPAAPTAPGKSVCDGDTVTLTATAPGGTYSWFDSASGGNLIGSGANYTTPVLNSSATYYVQSTILGCAGPRTSVNVTVNPIPVAPLTQGTTICQGLSATLTATAPPGTYQWYTAATGGTLLYSGSTYITPVLNSTATYYVQATLNGCSGARTPVTVTVTPTDNPAFSYASSTYCISGSNPTPSITGGFSGIFGSTPAGLVFINTGTGEINIAASAMKTYTVSYTTNGPCPATSSVSITITNAPDATFSYIGSYCHGSGTAFPSFAAGASAGNFSASPAGLVFVNTGTGVVNLNTSVPGTYTVNNFIAAAGGCVADSASNTITINAAPTVNAGTDQSICSGSTVTLSGTIGGSASGATWTGAGSFSNSSNLNATYTPGAAEISAGKATLVLTTDDPAGPCNAVSDTVVLLIGRDDPSFTYASGTYCATGTDPLPLVTGAAGGTFSSSPAGLVFISTSTGQIDVSASVLGTYTVTYTTNGACPDSTSQNVTLTLAPNASFTYATPFCTANNNPLPSFGAGASAGVFSAMPSGIVFVNSSTGEINLSASTAGTYTLTNNIAASGGCAAAAASYIVTIYPKAIVNAGSDQSICTGSSVTLAGSIGGSASGATWTGGTGTFAPNNTALNASYTPATGETSITLALTTDDPAGSCTAATDTITIIVNSIPAAPVASGTTICSGTSATLTATAPGGNYQWYDSPSGGTLLASGTSYTTPVLISSATYYVQTTVLGCTSPRTAVSVTLTPAPAVNAGSNIVICGGIANANLSGAVSGGASTGKWSTSGSGTFSPNDSALNATYIPSMTDTVAGVWLLLTSTNNGNCNAVTDSMRVDFIQQPVAFAGNDQSICSNETFSLNGNISFGLGTGIWSSPNGSGSFIPSAIDLKGTYIPSAADTAAKTVTLILTSTNNGNCTASTDTVIITIVPGPAVNAGADQSVCSNSAVVNINGTVTLAGGIKWTSLGGGSISPNDSSFTISYTADSSDIAKGNVKLVLTSVQNGACSPARDTVTITINPGPAANAGADMNICRGTANVSLNGGVTGATSTGKWSTMGSGTFSPNDSTLNATYTFSSADTTAGSVKLILQSSNNGSCLPSYDTLEIIITPVPVVNAGADQTVCGNNAVVLLNGNVIGTSASGTWSSTGSGTFSPGNTSLNASYQPDSTDIASGIVTLILTSTNSCLPVKDTMTVTITPAPSVDAGNNATVCNSALINLTGVVTGAAGGRWTGSGDGSFSPHDSALNATYTPGISDKINGNVTLYLASAGNGLCNPVTDSVMITLAPAPEANFTNNTICSGLSMNFNDATTISGGTLASWYWDLGNGNTSLSQNPSVTYTSAGSYTVMLMATSNTGCTDTIRKAITVNPSPLANFAVLAGCNGDSVRFTDKSTILSGTITGWSWNFGDTSLSNLPNPLHYYTSGGSYNVSLTVTSDSGCISSRTDTVFVNASPVANFNTGNACAGSNISFTDNSAASSGTINKWMWYFGDGSTSTQQHPVHTYPAAGTYSVSLKITTDNNCSDSIARIIIIESKPIVKFGGDTLSGCLPLTVNFSDSSSASPGSTYLWDFGDNDTSRIKDPIHTYTAQGTYSVKLYVTSPAGCSDSLIRLAYINVASLPLASFSSTPAPIKLPNALVSFVNMSGGGSTWLWDFGDGNTSTGKDPVHTYSAAGNYQVCLTAYNSYGCPASYCDTLTVGPSDATYFPVGVPNAFTPNGDKNNDMLRVRGGPMAEMELRIFNEWGNQIFYTNTQSEGWDGTLKGVPQPEGVYVYTLKGKTEDNRIINLYGTINLVR